MSIYWEVALTILRYVLAAVFADLARRHIISSDQSMRLVDQIIHDCVVYSPIFVIIWIAVKKIIKNRLQVNTALMEAKLSLDEVKTMISDPAVKTPTVTTPSNTVPGVPK